MALASMSMSRWLSVRLESLGALAALLAALVTLEARAGAGASGLLLSYAMQITQATSMAVYFASMAELMFNAGA